MSQCSTRIALLTLALGVLCGGTGGALRGFAALGAEFHVGPNQQYARVVDVPWEALKPGDVVFIHWRSAEQGGDYHEKINLTRAGTAELPIRLVGVKGPHGQRPCLNGKDAITRTVNPAANSTFYTGNQDRGILCYSCRNGGNFKSGHGADHWDITGLKITGARPANNYTDSFGKPRDYQRLQGGLGSAAAGVFIDRGNYLHFSDLELTDNNDGFFGSSDNYGSEARHVHDIVVENSLLYGNGALNNASVHNCYVEAANFTLRGNWFGRLVAGSGGSHIKDRGANVLIEGNFFDDAAVPLFLDPPEDSIGWMDKQPGFEKITVRNNVFYKPDARPFIGQDLIITGFADAKTDVKRTVEISHNTFVIAASRQNNWRVNLFQLMSKPQTILLEKNVLVRLTEGPGQTLSGINLVAKISAVDEQTTVDLSAGNWMVLADPWTTQTEGNGSARVIGLDKVGQLNGTARQLEEQLGINLHEPSAPDFGRFDAAKNRWYRDHQAGATQIPSAAAPPTPGMQTQAR